MDEAQPRSARHRSASSPATARGLDVGFEGLGAAPCVQLKIAHEHGEFDCIVCLARKSQTACCKRYRLILAEQDRLCLGRAKIGARRFGLAGTVQMLGAQHRIIGKDRGCGSVQLSLARVRKRAVHAVAYQRMRELQTVPGGAYQDIPHQRVAIVLRLLEKRPEMGKAEALAEDRGRLNRAAVLGG